jgi:hypothetical protein
MQVYSTLNPSADSLSNDNHHPLQTNSKECNEEGIQAPIQKPTQIQKEDVTCWAGLETH